MSSGCSHPRRGRGRAPTSCGSGPPRCRWCSARSRSSHGSPRELGQGFVRRVLGALARLRPVRGRQVVRLPPRRLRGLPRGRAGRRRPDRALGARARRSGRLAPGGRVRRLFAAANVVGAARRRGVHEHALGLRPAPRPLRLLPRAAVARGPRRWLAAGLPRPRRRGRDRRRSPRWCWRRPAVRAAGERGRDRHRPRCALGPDRGGARGAGARLGAPRTRAVRRRVARGDVLPSAGVARLALPAAVAVWFAASRTSRGSA